MTVALDTRRVLVGGRLRRVAAPAGDPFLARSAGGRSLKAFARLCRQVLPADGVAVDVGANIGLTTLVAASCATRGRVLAVEASHRNATALRRNLVGWGVRNATVVECAAGAAPGAAAFYDASAYGHVVTDANMAGFPGTAQRVASVDGLVAEHALTRLDLLKIDVEGFERDVLEGAGTTLERFDPPVLMEFNSWCMIAWFDRSPRQFLDWLLARFPQAYLWRDGRLADLRAEGQTAFLRRHLTEHRSNDDLLLSGPRTDLARLAARLGGPGRLGAALRRLRPSPR